MVALPRRLLVTDASQVFLSCRNRSVDAVVDTGFVLGLIAAGLCGRDRAR